MDEEMVKLLKLLLELQVNLFSLLLVRQLKKRKRSLNRRRLVRSIFKKRVALEHFTTLIQELKDDADMFFTHTRMDVNTFDCLHEFLSPYLTNEHSNICAEQRLIITLRYLATGDNISSIALAYHVAPSTCYNIIKETSKIIFEKLSPIFLDMPSEKEWYDVSEGFWNNWNLPHCCGAIDGKRITIKVPPNSGSLFFNYEKSYSIVLLAVCNHKYEFKLFDVGHTSSEGDDSILARSELGKAMRQGKLNIPVESKELPGSNVSVPYFFVGDETFEMSQKLMTPYSGRNLDDRQAIFNYRLSRGRRVIENSFGILVSRWQFLSKAIGLQPEFVITCVLAAITLHNFLMGSTDARRNRYCPSNYVDDILNNCEKNGQWRKETDSVQCLQAFNNINFQQEVCNAHAIRESLADYFLTREGEVPWQYNYISKGSYKDQAGD